MIKTNNLGRRKFEEIPTLQNTKEKSTECHKVVKAQIVTWSLG